MFDLTKQERLVLISLGFILLLGATINYAFKKNPSLLNIINTLDSNKIYPKTDLNKATYEELLAIPRIGPVTANNILAYRGEHGAFKAVEDVQSVKGVSHTTYQTISKYLRISPARK